METIDKIIARACAAAESDGKDLEAAVRDAGALRLDAARAERLYTRVLEEVRGLRRTGITDAERNAVKERIRLEVQRMVAEVPRPPADCSPVEGTGVAFVERRGFVPRPVEPMPSFYGVPVAMMEGYVDVTTLDPWAENQRVVVFVEEFEEKYGRKPTPDELLKILTGEVTLGDKKNDDPFGLRPLADSIARKGVERPPILTFAGVPCDGNRRIAASRLVMQDKRATPEEKERARWIRVWRAPPKTTKDQLDAIVVAMNFEHDHKEPWPEYVKARIVVNAFHELRTAEVRPPSTTRLKEIKDDVATKYAIKSSEVSRYLEMVSWANDFTDYHVARGRPKGEVQHRTNVIFQWFYELGAGRKGEKVTEQFEDDPELRAMLYDMMLDETIESGAQVRAMYAIASDPNGYKQLVEAHQRREKEPIEAKEIIKDAVVDARTRARARKAVGLDQYLKTLAERLRATPPSAWETFPTPFLEEIRATIHRTVGAIDGELAARSEPKARTAS